MDAPCDDASVVNIICETKALSILKTGTSSSHSNSPHIYPPPLQSNHHIARLSISLSTTRSRTDSIVALTLPTQQSCSIHCPRLSRLPTQPTGIQIRYNKVCIYTARCCTKSIRARPTTDSRAHRIYSHSNYKYVLLYHSSSLITTRAPITPNTPTPTKFTKDEYHTNILPGPQGQRETLIRGFPIRP